MIRVSLQQNLDGWCVSLHTRHQMPNDSPVFVFAERGDLAALTTMFSQQLATPNVCLSGDERSGNDLLFVSDKYREWRAAH